jgi:hypothetical protein
MSTYEGEHTIFGLLGQANLTQNDVLQFHVMSIFKTGSRKLFVQAGSEPRSSSFLTPD